jgi:hypothetical protein
LVRFDNYDMDLGAKSRAMFQAAGGPDPGAIDFSRRSPARDRWNVFRTDAIAAYVASVRRVIPARVSLGIYVLPPDFQEVGQDAAKFASAVDTIEPMCYFLDWGFDIDWLWSRCMPTTVDKAAATAVVPVLDAKLTDVDYRQIFTHLRHDFPRVTTVAWFLHDRWSKDLLARIGHSRWRLDSSPEVEPSDPAAP